MPNPDNLKAGDKVMFTGLPEVWEGGTGVSTEDVEFMKKVAALGGVYSVYEIDEYGCPWVEIVLPLKTESKSTPGVFLKIRVGRKSMSNNGK